MAKCTACQDTKVGSVTKTYVAGKVVKKTVNPCRRCK